MRTEVAVGTQKTGGHALLSANWNAGGENRRAGRGNPHSAVHCPFKLNTF